MSKERKTSDEMPPHTYLPKSQLLRLKRHFGSIPFYFEAVFEGEVEPSILNVEEVWQAYLSGRNAIKFTPLQLLTKEQHAFLFSLADAMKATS